MPNIKRLLDLSTILKSKSLFLFGPRQVGKSHLIRETLSQYPIYNLLDRKVFLRLSQDQTLLRQEIPKNTKIVVIDEIQKIPTLLDEVHLLIEERGIHFLLTGSSARKLKKANINLLGGRARNRALNPLIYKELVDHHPDEFSLLKALSYGLLPSIYYSDSPEEDLLAYVGDYLDLEISQEGASRDVPAFSRFLQVAANYNGQQINYSNISNDAQVKKSTVKNYFSILKDTLIGEELSVWNKTKIHKPVSTPKFYFFDIGVVRSLQERGSVKEKSADFGECFEAWIFHELRSYVNYNPIKKLHYWRSLSKYEVDFILDEQTAIEVKAKPIIGKKDLRGLRALVEEGLLRKYIVVSMVETKRTTDDGIEILPWKEFLERLWNGEFSTDE